MRVETIVESQDTPIDLTDSQAESLETLGKRLASQRLWWGDEEPVDRSVIRCRRGSGKTWTIYVREAVGAIAVKDLQITVVPKIPLPHFLHLAAASGFLPRIDEQPVAVMGGNELWDLVAIWYLRSAERLLRQELAKGYVEHVDELGTVRGQIQPVPTAFAYYRGARLATCAFEDFDEDTPLNRVVRQAAEVIAAGTPFDITLRRRAKAIVARMGRVGPMRHMDLRVDVDRLTKHYEPTLSFAKYLVIRSGVQIAGLGHSGWSFLIRTPELIESGVRETLARRLYPNWPIAKRKIRLDRTSVTLNPDLVIGDCLVTGDVKYRVVQTDWDRQHLYQAVAFATGFSARAAAVIGFQTRPAARRPQPLKVGSIDVRNFVWNASPGVNPEEAAAQLALELEQWLCSLLSETGALAAA